MADLPALTWLWVVMTVTVLVRVAVSLAFGIRVRRSAQPLNNARIDRALQAALTKLGLTGHPQLFTSDAVNCPVIWCWGRRPALLLPSGVAELPAEVDWVGILCHELAHWKRRDHLSGLFAEGVTCLLPWQPLAWWSKRRLRRLSEQACDDWALAAGQSPTSYAESLLGLVPQRRGMWALAPVVTRSGLVDRVRRILADIAPNPRLGWRWVAALTLLAATLVTAAALAQPGPASPESILSGTRQFTNWKGRVAPRSVPPASRPTSRPAAGTQPRAETSEPRYGVRSSAEGLVYHVQPKKETVTVGKGVGFTLMLTNRGDRPVTVFWPRDAYVDIYRFEIVGPDGRPIAGPRGPMKPVPREKNFIVLQPGQQVRRSGGWAVPPSGYRNQQLALNRPGKYVVRPSLGFIPLWVKDARTGRPAPGAPTEWIPAKPITLTVMRPTTQRLGKGVTVQGQVLEPGGKPLSGATAIIRASVDPRKYGPAYYEAPGRDTILEIGRATTRDDGRFTFLGVPEQLKMLLIECGHARFPATVHRLLLQPGQGQYDLRIQLKAGRTVRGFVRDSGGRGLAGVCISTYTDYKRVVYTDADGGFELTGLSRREGPTCHIWKEGYVGHNESPSADPWTIRLYLPEELAFSGRARFADGTPVRDFNVRFDLTDEQGNRSYAGIRTDGRGTFMGGLQRPGTFRGKVAATPRADGRQVLRWQTTIEGLRPGRKDVEIVLDSPVAVTAVVEPIQRFPRFAGFYTTCRYKASGDTSWRYVRATKMGAAGGRMKLTGLPPGRYRIETKFERSDRFLWTQEVTLPDDNKRQAEVRIRVPKVVFGTIRMRVVDPQDGSPVDFAWGQQFGRDKVFDEKGVLEFRDVLPGGFCVNVLGAGNVKMEVTGHVEPGQTLDLGDVPLRKNEPTESRITGRLLYDDGKPLIGASFASHFDSTEFIGRDGKYQTGLPVGRGNLILNLTGVPGWCGLGADPLQPVDRTSPYYLMIAPATNWQAYLYETVEIHAGKALKHDIIVKRAGRRNIPVRWLGDPKADVRIHVGVVLPSRRFSVSTRQGPPLDAAGRCVIPDVPAGRTMIWFRSKDYTGCQVFEAGQAIKQVTFDPAACGTIVGRAVRPDGRPAEGVRVGLRPELFPVFGPRPIPRYVHVSDPAASAVWQRPIDDLKPVRTAADGTFRLTGVAPGRYDLWLGTDKPATVHPVTVQTGKDSPLKLVTTARPDPPRASR